MKKVIYLPDYLLCVILEDNLIKGAFLGNEATRKYGILSNYMDNSLILSNYMDNSLLLGDSAGSFFMSIPEMNFHPVIMENSLFYWIEKSKGILISDYQNCGGLDSQAKSCDERKHYYYKVGMARFYKSNRPFYLSMFILNHISFFGNELSKNVFFGRMDTHVVSDNTVREKLPKHTVRYSPSTFKAPAYYVRAVINSYGG